jgi:hypothetical protein
MISGSQMDGGTWSTVLGTLEKVPSLVGADVVTDIKLDYDARAIQCLKDLTAKYCLELKLCDVKALKSVYKSLVERSRMKQNGSMTFR